MNEIPASAPPTAPTEVVNVTLVTTPACHFCDDAHQRLHALERAGLLRLTAVPAESPQGEALIAEHRPGSFPLTLVAGRYFHAGRIPRGKLARLVDRLGAR
ncbi:MULTISPECIES: glutaredoxin [Tessaracoccus]|uniref:Glutaredoxin n=1 Tax=Tessaracoccus lacteus TaxID=3041766 RepID=A0ABY8PUA6_9ACTN|nr:MULTISPECIES: glutaredoxin [Tessaracoccus]WGT46020.1 glutaredoxin [Tessaracoccus sp. T21]